MHSYLASYVAIYVRGNFSALKCTVASSVVLVN